MERVAEAVNGQWTMLWPSFSHPAAADITSWARLDPALLPLYAEHYASVNVISQGIERLRRDLPLSYSHQVISDENFARTEYYNDFFKPNGLFYVAGLKLNVGMEAPAFISSVRPKASGPFGRNDEVVLTTLLPHLQRALKLHLQFSQLRLQTGGLEAALNAFDVAVFGLNNAGRVVFGNPAAQQLAQSGDGIRLRGGQMVANGIEQNRELQRVISAAVATGNSQGISPGGALLLRRRLAKTPLAVTITPYSPGLRNYGQLVALVFVADELRKPLARSAILRKLYGLTPAECRMADLLAAGHEIAAAAECLKITVQTGRFHLKTIFRKTGTNRQATLVRLMLSLPGESKSALPTAAKL